MYKRPQLVVVSSSNVMNFQRVFDHVLAPVDEYQIQALRNAVLCGIIAFAFAIVGVSQLLCLLGYLFVVALTCVFAWLYSLTPDTRGQVFERIKDVIRGFWRKCVDETFGDKRAGKANRSAGRQRDKVAADNGTEASSGAAASDTSHSGDPSRIDLLVEDFRDHFDVDSSK